MQRTLLLTGLIAGLILVSTGAAQSWGSAQLDAKLSPYVDSSPFEMRYLRTVSIVYENGGAIADELRGQMISASGDYNVQNDAGVKMLRDKLNEAIVASDSQVQISDLNVNYIINLSGRDTSASIDYKVVVQGNLTNYVITGDEEKALVDMGWRGLSVSDAIVVGGNEINNPFWFIRVNTPMTYDILSGTDAEPIFTERLINADYILEQPLENWHFLFDPTGINVDAGTFGLSDEIAGFVVSAWTMGESNLKQGRQVEIIKEAVVQADQEYTVRSTESPDQGTLHIIGYGVISVIDGVEIVGVTAEAPDQTATGDFPIFIIYGMAGMAAVAGIAFFFVSNRALKNEKQGQQGIDPSHLVGYQTSSASGGYQTNRGEAQLRGDVDYQQTRSHYVAEESSAREPEPMTAQEDATCGCQASAEMGIECDCAMQSSCICDNTCRCGSDVCRDYVGTLE